MTRSSKIFCRLFIWIICLYTFWFLLHIARVNLSQASIAGEKHISLSEAAVLVEWQKTLLGVKEKIVLNIDDDTPGFIGGAMKELDEQGAVYYNIRVNPTELKPGVVRHEVYHIADKYCDLSFEYWQRLERHEYGWLMEWLIPIYVRRIRYELMSEPSASLYAFLTKEK